MFDSFFDTSYYLAKIFMVFFIGFWISDFIFGLIQKKLRFREWVIPAFIREKEVDVETLVKYALRGFFLALSALVVVIFLKPFGGWFFQ